MKIVMLVITLLSLMFMFTVAEAQSQNVKTITWAEFWAGLEFKELGDGKWDFVHASRPLHEYTVVKVPRGLLIIRHLYRVGSTDGLALYLVVLDMAVPQKFQGREVSVRMMFTCPVFNKDCRTTLAERLEKDITVQALGVSNSGYEGGSLPEKPIFSFHMIHREVL